MIKVTLAAEKAFGKVDYEWLFQVMTHMDFGGHLLQFLKNMYSSPVARIVW